MQLFGLPVVVQFKVTNPPPLASWRGVADSSTVGIGGPGGVGAGVATHRGAYEGIGIMPIAVGPIFASSFGSLGSAART